MLNQLIVKPNSYVMGRRCRPVGPLHLNNNLEMSWVVALENFSSTSLIGGMLRWLPTTSRYKRETKT